MLSRYCFRLQWLALSAALLGCSHPLEIVGEGDIVDLNGTSHGCTYEEFQTARTDCTFNLVVGAYNVSYAAVPRPGWRFSHWEGSCSMFLPDQNCAFNVSAEKVNEYWGKTIAPARAVFKEGYLVDAWFDSGERVTSNQRDITLLSMGAPLSEYVSPYLLVAGGSTVIMLNQNLNIAAKFAHGDAAFGAPSRDIYLEVHSVVRQQNVLYIAKREGSGATPRLGNVIAVDVTRPRAPVLLDELEFPEAPSDLEVSGNQLTVALRKGGVAIVDISDPTDMRVLSRLHDDGTYSLYEMMSVGRSGDLACGPNYFHGMVLFNIDDAGIITEIPGSRKKANGTYYSHNGRVWYWDCVIRPDHRYAFFTGAPNDTSWGAPKSVLDVMDISDPGNPRHVAGVEFGLPSLHDYPGGPVPDRAPQQVASFFSESRQLLFVANGDVGVEVVDVARPEAPVHEATLHVPGIYTYGVAVDRDYLYVGALKRVDNPLGGGVLRYDLAGLLEDALTGEHKVFQLDRE